MASSRLQLLLLMSVCSVCRAVQASAEEIETNVKGQEGNFQGNVTDAAKTSCMSALELHTTEDNAIMLKCCLAKTQLTTKQCIAVISALQGNADISILNMKSTSHGMTQENQYNNMTKTKSNPVPEPEPEPEPHNKTTDGKKTTQENKSNPEPEPEPEPHNKTTDGKKTTQEMPKDMKEQGNVMKDDDLVYTMEMMAAEKEILDCYMMTQGFVTESSEVKGSEVRKFWAGRVKSTAGEDMKKIIESCLEECPLISKNEIAMYPQCLVKKCANKVRL